MVTEQFSVEIGRKYLFEWADRNDLSMSGVVRSFVPLPDGSAGIEVEEWRDGAPTRHRRFLFGAHAFRVTTIQ